MMIALLIAVALPAPATAIEAERAFAADAQKLGQWNAFRKWAARDALMFTPQPVNAHTFMRPLKDPPHAVFWWPGRSYVSCDGRMAINTGPWVRGFGKAIGYFTTVWERQPNGGWKWTYDAGDELKFARDEGGDIKPVIAACSAAKAPPPVKSMGPGSKAAAGGSADGTLRYAWQVRPDGAREFRAWLWDGKVMQPVILDEVGPPAPPPAKP